MTFNGDTRFWIEHRYYRTYALAGRVARIANRPDYHELEDLTVDGRVFDFIAPWQRKTLLHKFVQWVADDMFIRDTSGPYAVTHEMDGEGRVEVVRYLPVEIALRAYGIVDDEPEPLPPPDGEFVQEGNIRRWEESDEVANYCYDQFINWYATQSTI